MPTITLKVSGVAISSDPREIDLTISRPYVSPFYISLVTITENTDLSVIDGDITPGSGTSDPGEVDIELPTQLFSTLWDFVATHTRLTITITYNDDLTVTKVTLAAALAVFDNDQLQAALANLGSVDIVGAVSSLAMIANTLAEALHKFAPAFLPGGEGTPARKVGAAE